MKYLYFWCDIVTPHWLHTLQEMAEIMRVDIVIYADSLAMPDERKVFGWDESLRFASLEFRLKKDVELSQVPSFEAGYHLVCNPFNNAFNRKLLAVMQANGIKFGLQQSKPGLISSLSGKILRLVGYGVVFRGTVAAASYVLCHGDMCRQFLISTVGQSQKLFSSGYFIPDIKLPGRRSPGEKLRAVFLGQFIPRKRVVPFAALLAEDPRSTGIVFDFVGGGPLEERLRSIWPVEKGSVLPPVPRDDVIPFLSQYDVLVLPSAADEWGVVVNEAIHAGCAVIVTSNCGSSDLVGYSGCGRVVDTTEQCVEALIALHEDRNLLDSCRRKANDLSPRISAKSGAQYLAKILSGLEHAEGPGACLPPWADSNDCSVKLRLSIVYHFFAHYRYPIIRELMDSNSLEILCYGSTTSEGIDPSIEPLTLKQLPNLRVTPVLTRGNFVWQKKIVVPLLRDNSDVYIFLASPYFLSTWVAAALLRVKGKQVLFWGHLRYKFSDSWLKRPFRMGFYKLATGWLCYGHTAKKELIDNGISEGAIHVIYNSLDYEKHILLRAVAPAGDFVHPLPRPEEGFFICVSRLVEKRRLDLLFQAMAVLRSKGSPIRVLLVGDGSSRASLEHLARSMNLDVCFYGACYDEEALRELYRGAIATVAPGEVGLSAIQSLAFGVPVITHSDSESQMPEAEAIIEGATGWLFKKEDIADMVRALEKALAHDREKMRSICYRVIDLFFNPRKQVEVIQRSSLGLLAKDHDWEEFIKEIKK